jgi:hypothetical protein
MSERPAQLKERPVEVAELRRALPARRRISHALLRRFPSEPVRPIRLDESWWVFAAVAAGVCGVLAVAIWVSAHVHPDAALRNVALFVHLASLTTGLGAVLVADYLLARWLLGRCTFAEAVHAAAPLHALVWTGLIGLGLSGILLHPDLSAGRARVKLVLVAILTLNGLQAMVLSKRAEASGNALSVRLLAWGGATTAVSQASWWGAVVIGFLTANKL